MSLAVGHRVRWFAVWILVGVWFAGIAFKWFGDWLNLVLVLAIALVVYELLTTGADEPGST